MFFKPHDFNEDNGNLKDSRVQVEFIFLNKKESTEQVRGENNLFICNLSFSATWLCSPKFVKSKKSNFWLFTVGDATRFVPHLIFPNFRQKKRKNCTTFDKKQFLRQTHTYDHKIISNSEISSFQNNPFCQKFLGCSLFK